jgi:hypothetical protein
MRAVFSAPATESSRRAAIKKRLMEERKRIMEWHYEPATLIPVEIRAEHVDPGLSQIGVVVYDDGLFSDALIAQCAADLVASGCRLGGCDFLTFVGDSTTRLKPDIEAITAWCRNAIEPPPHHRFQPRLSSAQA